MGRKRLERKKERKKEYSNMKQCIRELQLLIHITAEKSAA
jgi:hypothetical protein